MCSVQILLHDLSVDKHRIMLFRTKKNTFILCSEMPPKRLFIRKDYSEQVPQTVPRRVSIAQSWIFAAYQMAWERRGKQSYQAGV